MEILTSSTPIGKSEMAYFRFGGGSKIMVILPGIDVKSIIPAAPAVARAYREFADDYTVYVFDRLRDVPDGYSIRDMARDTAAAMDALGLTGAYVFGASQGGMIAQMMMIDRPDLLRAAVLGSTMCRTNPTANETVGRWIELGEQEDILALTGDFIDRLYSPRTIGRHREMLIHMNDGVSADDLRRFVILARSIDDFDCCDELQGIAIPVLVIGVEGDRALTGGASREIAEILGCELYMYGEEYGHCVFDEAKDYQSRIRAFFDRF